MLHQCIFLTSLLLSNLNFDLVISRLGPQRDAVGSTVALQQEVFGLNLALNPLHGVCMFSVSVCPHGCLSCDGTLSCSGCTPPLDQWLLEIISSSPCKPASGYRGWVAFPYFPFNFHPVLGGFTSIFCYQFCIRFSYFSMVPLFLYCFIHMTIKS